MMLLVIILLLILTYTVGAIAANDRYTEGILPMHVIDINCTGTENRILDCSYNNLVGVHVCDHLQDASVRCQGTCVVSSIIIY